MTLTSYEETKRGNNKSTSSLKKPGFHYRKVEPMNTIGADATNKKDLFRSRSKIDL